MRLRSILGAGAMLAVSLLPLSAQEFRAAVTGTVSDQQGAVIPGVAIEVRSAATNNTYTTSTNETGSYVVPFVPIGVYTVTASSDGFKTGIREHLELPWATACAWIL